MSFSTPTNISPIPTHHELVEEFSQYQMAKVLQSPAVQFLCGTTSALSRMSRWSVAKILFFLNRYLVFGQSTAMVLAEIAFRKPSLQFCTSIIQVAGYLSVTGFTIADLVLMLRTWAIWERNATVTALLVTVFFSFLGADIFFTHQYVAGAMRERPIKLLFISHPVNPPLQHCMSFPTADARSFFTTDASSILFLRKC
ncbi:hypothetical protein BD410DRAFT_348338 [Rickenella mellea]|uniref:Uncharacterized protein n=1 Tax=Rickenella mellea TaxID=50990 RepID=A0A4Y7QLP9_9AGAM|nr:hypothetical protein BD410DRAFT_348338 [Rickenella mellea]